MVKKHAFCGIVRKFAAKIIIFTDQMKNFYCVLCLLSMMALLFTSCSTDDDSSTSLYNDAAISEFVIGDLNQYAPGTDSVIAKLTGTNYKMSINQVNADGKGYTIFNRELLPYGTRIDSVLCTISTVNTSGITVKNIDNDQFQLFSSSTGIDFSQAGHSRIFRIYSSDGTYQRDYTVTLNIKEEADKEFSWQNIADTTLLAGYKHMRILVLDTILVALGEKGTNTEVLLSQDKGKKWQSTAAMLDQTAWESAIVKDSMAYTLSGGNLLSSKDGATWTIDGSANVGSLKQLVGAGTCELFALGKDSTLWASNDNGKNWNTESVSSSLSVDSLKCLTALENISFTCFPFEASDSTDYDLLIGSGKSSTVVWRKISQYGSIGKGGKWVNIPMESINLYQIPQQSRLSLVRTDEGVVLAYGAGTTAYQTTDQGITWRANATYVLPAEVLTVGAGKDGILWAVSADGKVWRGTK